MRYLLDTNILSEPLKPRPVFPVLERLQRYETELVTASVVWHELWFGCARLLPSERQATIQAYLEMLRRVGLPILGYDAAAARWHGEERARLQKQGKSPSFADGQIAAIAKTQGLVLVTRNSSDFQCFEGLVLENWFEA